MKLFVDPDPSKEKMKEGLVLAFSKPIHDSPIMDIQLLVVEDPIKAAGNWENITTILWFGGYLENSDEDLIRYGIKSVGLGDVPEQDRQEWTGALRDIQEVVTSRGIKEKDISRRRYL